MQNNSLLCQNTERSSWMGKWIWVDSDFAARNIYAMFRRTVSIESSGKLNISISADSHYMLYVDGEFIARGPARAPLDYYLYDSFYLLLAPGSHCIAVVVHHAGEVNACMMLGRPGLLADISINSAGNVIDLSTGPEWLCLLSDAWLRDLPKMMSHFSFWEDCNLAKIPVDWMLADFCCENWKQAVVIGEPPCAPWIRLMQRDISMPEITKIAENKIVGNGNWEESPENATIPSIQVAARNREPDIDIISLPAKFSLIPEKTGRYITIDYGSTISGYLEIEIALSSPGTIIELSYDELLTQDSFVNPERSYAHLTDRFHLPGGACIFRTLHPRGFRYVMIDISGEGYIEIKRATAIQEVYPFIPQPSFKTDDNILMTFVSKSLKTVKACTTDSFTDCPTRERVQWMEDLYMHSKASAYSFGDTGMMRHALFQGAQCALPDGRINGFFPSERTGCAFAAGSIMWLHLLVDYWLHAGNDDIRNLLPTAVKLINFINSQIDDTDVIAGWPVGQFWDWAPIEDRGCLLLTNACYVWALERLQGYDIFSEIGIDLSGCAEKIRQSAHLLFWDNNRGLYCDTPTGKSDSPIYSQQANTMAVLSGICPVNKRAALLSSIIDSANLGPVPVGEQSFGKVPKYEKIVPMGTLWFAHFLCQALFEEGMDEIALSQMRNFWGQYDNLPTFPETRIQDGNTGHCHGWTAGPAYLLPAYVLGVQPIGAGWSKVRVNPHPGDLTTAKGTFNTPNGQVTAEWKLKNGKVDIEVIANDKIIVCR